MSRPPTDPDVLAVREQTKVLRRLVAILVLVVGVAALKLSAPVTLPLTFALFLIAVFWPLQRRFERRMARGAAVLVTLAVFLVVVALFLGAFWLSWEVVQDEWPRYSSRLDRVLADARAWAAGHGLVAAGPDAAEETPARRLVVPLAKGAYAVIGGFVLVLAFLVLGLLEVRDYGTKMRRISRQEGGPDASWRDTVHRITADFQRYVGVRTLVGLITGVAVGLYSWAVGLELAVVWGLTNFLLNYIPTLGSILGVIPPSLFAFLQFGVSGRALLVAAGIAGIQLVMGNYVDPLLQGRYLSLSPFVVLLAVTFWGWVWGVAGAFIGVPLTVAIVITCNHFPRTRWIAVLLAEVRDGEAEADGSEREAGPPAAPGPEPRAG